MKKKKAIRSIRQGKFRQDTFNVLSKHVRKGSKASLKKVRMIDDKGEVLTEHQDRKSIEEEAIKHETNHFTQVRSTKAHRDKTHHRLTNNKARDRMLNGDLSVEECD